MARHVPTLTSNIKHLYFDTPSYRGGTDKCNGSKKPSTEMALLTNYQLCVRCLSFVKKRFQRGFYFVAVVGDAQNQVLVFPCLEQLLE